MTIREISYATCNQRLQVAGIEPTGNTGQLQSGLYMAFFILYYVYIHNKQENVMQEFTTTDMRRSSPEIYNKVQQNKAVMICHRDRPKMVLMTEEYFNRLTKQKAG